MPKLRGQMRAVGAYAPKIDLFISVAGFLQCVPLGLMCSGPRTYNSIRQHYAKQSLLIEVVSSQTHHPKRFV